MTLETLRDKDWVRKAFMVPESALLEADRRKRGRTSAEFKFTDTRLGGNFSINNPPQYTRHADLKVSGMALDSKGFTSSGGMGRFYSEQMDDNAQVIHMIFGVPQYNGMFTFFTGFYDGESSYLARTGRAPGAFYRLGQVGGFVVSLGYIEIIALGNILRILAQTPSDKYYYFKPAMGAYWNRVNMIANELAINMRLIPPALDWFKNSVYDAARDGNSFTEEDIKSYHESYPDIFKETGGIDVYQIANRGQRLAHANRYKLKELFESSSTTEDMRERFNKYRSEALEDKIVPVEGTNGTVLTGIAALIEREHNYDGAAGYPDPLKEGDSTDTIVDKGYRKQLTPDDLKSAEEVVNQTGFFDSVAAVFGGDESSEANDPPGFVDRLVQNSLANLRDGAQFVSFRVDYTGQVSESFSNSVKESEIASKINGFSSSARSTKFSLSGGNTGVGLIDSVTSAIMDFGRGAIDGLQISGLIGLFGSSFVDIPKVWDDSTANLPKSDYTIQLRSPYGNDMSRLINLFVPLSCLLAGALPISTGKASYSSPFICQLYDQGRNQIRLGIIDSLSITRGVGNMGFTPEGKVLGIDVTFSVIDLSSLMHAPIVSGGDISAGDNAFTDYLATLSTLSLADQIYTSRRLMLNLTKKVESFRSYWSVSHFSSAMFNGWPARWMSAFADDSAITGG